MPKPSRLMNRFRVSREENLSLVTGANLITDTDTGVQYLFVTSGYAGGLTVLVDADGKPLVDKSAIKTEEVK